jgi:hypothetical protein
MIKPTKAQLKIMKEQWKELQEISDYYYEGIDRIQEHMQSLTGLDVEFFRNSFGEFCGIGNYDRSMKLIHDYQLEK